MSQNSTLSQKPLKIFFFGAPYFSREILNYLLKNDIRIDTVITHPDQPVGRKKILVPTETKILAQKNNIPIKEFQKLDETALDFFKKEEPNLFIVASYGTIIPKRILDVPTLGALNVHPSLLPKLRGASPIQTALSQGLKETGTTIMLMDEKMDTGNIIQQKKIPIPSTEIYPKLEQRLANLSNELLLPIVQKIKSLRQTPPSTIQDNNHATYTKLIKKQNGLIDWHNSAKEIYHQWQAFYSWPQIYTFYNGQKLTLTEIELFPKNDIINNDKYEIGEVLSNEQGAILINTPNDSIKINKLQLAGKNELSIQDFLNGQNKFIGTILV